MGNAEKTVAAMVDKLKQDNLLAKGDIFVTTLSVPANQNLKSNTVQLGIVD
jgi:pyruvate kinase